MQVRELSWDEVVTAGTVIFGPSFGAFARAGAWRGELRTAYRRRALETHPDRAALLGRSETELLREFRAVTEAYELLVQLRPAPPPRSRAPAARAAPEREPATRPSRTAPAAPGAGRIDWASRVLPHRRLRLAEFLYYAGLVPWSDFVGAVAWQRRQRPAVGRIAVDFGFLVPGDVWEILERRRREGGAGGEPFGEFAVRRGYLSPFQLLALLGQQLRLQRPIGRYFVERGLVSDADLDAVRAAVFRHNLRHPR